MKDKYKKVEFLRKDYPHSWIFNFEVTKEIKEWWYGKN